MKSFQSLCFLLGVLIIGILVAQLLPFISSGSRSSFEGFHVLGNTWLNEKGGLLGEGTFYAATGDIHTGNEGAADMWWKAPVFQVGDYRQLTNNIQFPKSTDEGRCTPAEFCDTLYKDRSPSVSNISTVAPPVDEYKGDNRNGYFVTSTEPIKTFTNTENILY